MNPLRPGASAFVRLDPRNPLQAVVEQPDLIPMSIADDRVGPGVRWCCDLPFPLVGRVVHVKPQRRRYAYSARANI